MADNRNIDQIPLQGSDLDMLEQRVKTSTERVEKQRKVIFDLKLELKKAEDELLYREDLLRRDIRICDAIAEMITE